MPAAQAAPPPSAEPPPEAAPSSAAPRPEPASRDVNEARSVQEELEVLARMAEAGLPEEPAADVPAAEEASPMAPEPAPAPAEPPPPAVPIPAEPAPEPAGDRPETPEAPGVEDGDQAVLNALDSLANRVHATERNMEEILSPLEQAVRGLEQQLESFDSDDPGGEGATVTPSRVTAR